MTGTCARWAAAAALSLLLAACSQGRDDRTVDVHEAMKDGIDVKGDALWDIANLAIDDKGGIDGSAMTPDNWKNLAVAGDWLAAEADRLALAKQFVVAPDGAKLLDEDRPGGASKQQVRDLIAADPQGFRDMARGLADHARAIAAAARDRNADEAGTLVTDLDGVCETCHVAYWYPDMREASPYAKAHVAKAAGAD